MASYQVVGRNGEGSPLLSVAVGAVEQDGHYLDDMVVVNAVRAAIAGADGVVSVVAKKYEQVITVV